MNDSNVEKVKIRAINELEIGKLPDDVSISTMTVICKINTNFICSNIGRYVDLSHTCILAIKHGKTGDPSTNRSLLFKKSTTKKKKTKSVFYNQVSLSVHINSKGKKPVNIKLFSNGAMQLTGCKTVDNAVETIYKVFNELKKVKAIIDYKQQKVVEKPFVENPNLLDITCVKNFQIVMINSNFKIPFKIDRNKLYNLLLEENYECLYDPVKHACVNIKYEHPEKTISVFVFEKGAIIITGARNCSQIYGAYIFINKYLLLNHKKIVKNDKLTNENINKYLRPANDDNSDSDSDFE